MKTKKKELFRCNIAGVQYGDYQLCLGLGAGLKLKLIWERGNPHDNMAIRVEYQGFKLGYIPKGEYQLLCHSYRERGVKLHVSLSSVNKTNPTWCMFVVKCEIYNKVAQKKEVEF